MSLLSSVIARSYLFASHTQAHLKMADKVFPLALDWVFKKTFHSLSLLIL